MKKLYAIILFAAMIILAAAGLGVGYLRSMQDNGYMRSYYSRR